MEKEEKMYKNVQNVKEEESSKNWFNLGQVCILKHHKNVLIAKEWVKL